MMNLNNLIHAYEHIEKTRARLPATGESNADLHYAGIQIVILIRRYGTVEEKARVGAITKRYAR
jgi:hypothetical protein